MSYALSQVDPTPPPTRPMNWPMILGWTAVVGMTIAVFNGTINLQGGRVKANRRHRSSRRRSSRRRSLRRNPRYRMWSGPVYAKDLAKAIRDAGAHDVIAGTEHVIFRTDDLEALKARAGSAKPFLDFRGVKMMMANASRRSSHARPKPPKFSEMAIWQAIAAVRESGRSSEIASILPPGVAAKFKHLAPGLYKYGRGPKKGEVIVQFKNAGLKGALTSTRIGASKVGEYHWVVDNFDPKFPVAIRGIDDHGRTFFRIEEHARKFERVPVRVSRKTAAR